MTDSFCLFRGCADLAMGTPLVREVQMGDAEAGTSRKVAPITDFGKVNSVVAGIIYMK
jgi:hypothetical protein